MPPPSRLLGLREGELPSVARLALVYAGIGGATAIGDALVQAAFLARAGADALPWVLGVRAILSPLLAWLYSRWAQPNRSRGLLAMLCVLAAASTVGARFAIEAGPIGAIGAYAAHEIVTGLLALHWGVYLLDHLEHGAARRGVAPIYAAARGTAALGGLAVSLLVPTFSVGQALWIAAAAFLAIAPCAFVPRRLARETERASVRPPLEPASRIPFRRGWALLRSSKLLVAISVATIVMVLVRITLRHGHQAVLDAYPEEVLAPLLGAYVAGANVVSVLLQLLVTSRLLERLGVGTTNLLYAWATLVTEVLLLVVRQGSLAIAFGARFAEGELKHALKTPVSPLFYEGFWGADRARARAFVLGVVSPLAQVLAAGVLGLLVAGPEGSVALVGTIAAALYVAASVVQGRAHREAMERLPTRESTQLM